MSPQNNIKVLNSTNLPNSYIWFPPECWNNELIELAEMKNLRYLKDICPFATYLRLNAKYNK